MVSNRAPLHLWPLLKGFVIPLIPLILGVLYATNTAEGRASLDILVLSIFSAPLIAIGFLIYEHYSEQRVMMYGTGAALILMMLFLVGLFTN
jgi:hypothetical protein